MEKVEPQRTTANDETRAAWNANASFWDERMGEGNDFVNVLPLRRKLLRPGRQLTVICTFATRSLTRAMSIMTVAVPAP